MGRIPWMARTDLKVPSIFLIFLSKKKPFPRTPKLEQSNSIIVNTHYIHSVMVQDFVSGRVCCVNQYHYESLSRLVVMRLVHATDKTWYTVWYHHTMYVITLSNISIKTNFKEIARVELKCVQYSWGRLHFVYDVKLFFLFIHQCQVIMFCLTFQWYDVMSK
jgi:hypothetical protein